MGIKTITGKIIYMKHLSKLIFFSSLLAIVLVSCKKDENKVFFEGGTPPVLTASVTGSIPLSFANKDNLGISLSWTNPDYQFNTGISSQDVNYLIEIDRVGADFKSANRQTVAISNAQSRSFTQGEFNDFLLNQLLLDTSKVANIEIRVKATLANGSVPLVSNVFRYTVVPYPIPPKVNPPASGKLFITGSATPASWMGGGDPENAAQKFTKITNTLYELPSIALNGGGSYLFVPQYGDWGAKYGGVGATGNSNNVNGDDFKADGTDLLAPPASGNYKITVDFQRGKFTVTKL